MRLAILFAPALAALCLAGPAGAPGASVGGPRSPAGEPLRCELPHDLHLRNTGGLGRGGPGTGAGLCVFTSIEMAARLQDLDQLAGLQQWMTRRPGGGWPEKVDQVLAEFCREKGVAPPSYVQAEGEDLDLLRRATRAGRMACTTYSVSPTGRYGGKRIAHMVCLPHAGKDWFAVLDNNYPGADAYEWLTEAEARRSLAPHWYVILVPGPPPPRPTH